MAAALFFDLLEASHTAVDFVLWIGPGAVFVGLVLLVWHAIDRIRAALRTCRYETPPQPSAIEGLEQLEDHLTAHWQHLTDEARKEKP